MKVDHIAIWVHDLEKMRSFYSTYFSMECGEMYVNPLKRFRSYFLKFSSGECRIELMHRADILDNSAQSAIIGFAHFAITIGDKLTVNEKVELLRNDGFPRRKIDDRTALRWKKISRSFQQRV